MNKTQRKKKKQNKKQSRDADYRELKRQMRDIDYNGEGYRDNTADAALRNLIRKGIDMPVKKNTPAPSSTRPPKQKKLRPDHEGPHRSEYTRNKAKILKRDSICGICGQPVDKSLKYPDPMSPTVDHIIPIDKGGHPSDMDNLQLAHWRCNRNKSDKIIGEQKQVVPTNRDLPHSIDWVNY